MTLALFHKEPLSQARRLAWGLDKWLCCGVWEADEGGVQGLLWGTQQAQHVFIPSQNRLICEPTPAPGHLDLGIEAGTRWPVSKGLTQTAPSPSRGSTRNNGPSRKQKGRRFGETSRRPGWEPCVLNRLQGSSTIWKVNIKPEYHCLGGTPSNYSHSSCGPDADGQSHTRAVWGVGSVVMQRRAGCLPSEGLLDFLRTRKSSSWSSAWAAGRTRELCVKQRTLGAGVF